MCSCSIGLLDYNAWMEGANFFELNSWGLSDPASRAYAQAAFSHNLSALQSLGRPASWPSVVDPFHLFACGSPRGGGLYASRQVLHCLLDQGANLNAVDNSGWVPLSYAAWFGLAGSLDVLLEANAEVHPVKASLPLTQALSALAQNPNGGAHETCARLLLMSGADPLKCSISDSTGRSSFLSWALSVGRMEIVHLLWAKGDRIRHDKELAMLVWDAEVQALDWLMEHEYNVLEFLPQTHPHYSALSQIKSARNREQLCQVAATLRAANGLSSIEEDDPRAM